MLLWVCFYSITFWNWKNIWYWWNIYL